MFDGKPTMAMIERAVSWLEQHGIEDKGRAQDLASVFAAWAAEYERRGAFGENVVVPLVGELLTAEPFAVQLVDALEADPVLAARFRAILAAR